MASSFRATVKKATPKPCINFEDSPLREFYIRTDDKLQHSPELRLEVIKGVCRSYLKHRKLLPYTIKQLEMYAGGAQDVGCSTDTFFNVLFERSKVDKRFAFLLSSIYGLMRKDPKTPKTSDSLPPRLSNINIIDLLIKRKPD